MSGKEALMRDNLANQRESATTRKVRIKIYKPPYLDTEDNIHNFNIP